LEAAVEIAEDIAELELTPTLEPFGE
jgi:hypothetical protein